MDKTIKKIKKLHKDVCAERLEGFVFLDTVEALIEECGLPERSLGYIQRQLEDINGCLFPTSIAWMEEVESMLKKTNA